MTTNPGHQPIDPCAWDVVVIGAGAAGLMTCLELPAGLNVLLLNRNTGRRSSSRWAQGGIAAVTRLDDSIASHAEDTRRAGNGLCDEDAVDVRRLNVVVTPAVVAACLRCLGRCVGILDGGPRLLVRTDSSRRCS